MVTLNIIGQMQIIAHQDFLKYLNYAENKNI